MEPLTREVRILRKSTSCTLGNTEVDAIVPGSRNNPTNVKNVEQVLPEWKFQEFFPRRNEAYTYRNFLKAMGKYPAICRNSDNCSKILAAMFAHFQQETAGLFYLEEINKEHAYCAKWSEWVAEAYPCVQAPFSYLTLYCPILNESSGPKQVTHHIFSSVQKIAIVQRKKELSSVVK